MSFAHCFKYLLSTPAKTLCQSELQILACSNNRHRQLDRPMKCILSWMNLMTELMVVNVCMVRHPPLLRITTPFGCHQARMCQNDLWLFLRFRAQSVAQTKTLTTIVLCSCTLISRPFHLMWRFPPREPAWCLCPPGTPIPTGRRFWTWLFGLKLVGLNRLCWPANKCVCIVT